MEAEAALICSVRVTLSSHYNSCRAKERAELNITNGRSSLNGGEAGGYAQ